MPPNEKSFMVLYPAALVTWRFKYSNKVLIPKLMVQAGFVSPTGASKPEGPGGIAPTFSECSMCHFFQPSLSPTIMTRAFLAYKLGGLDPLDFLAAPPARGIDPPSG